MAQRILFAAWFAAASLLGATLDDAAALQAKGDYAAAASAYTALIAEEGDHREARRRLGLCYIMMKRPADAVAAYEAYLSLYPDDLGVAEVLRTLKNEKETAKKMLIQRKEEARKPDDAPGPWLMAQFEFLSPVLFGLDLSTFPAKHHNFGVAISGFGNSSSSWTAWHPRYRWYRRQHQGWTIFAGAGAVLADYQMGLHGGKRTTDSLRGGDLTVGWAFLRPGIFTQEFYFSLAVLQHNRIENAGDPLESSSQGLYYAPLPGFGFGFAF